MHHPMLCPTAAFLMVGALGCNLFGSPEKRACKRISKFDEKMTTEQCVEDLSKMKEERPEQRECVLKCSSESDKQAFEDCAAKCIGEAAVASLSAEADESIDKLTPSRLKSGLSSHYGQGYKLITERSNDSGWVGTVGVDRHGDGEVKVLKVVLAEAGSAEAAEKLGKELKDDTTNPSEYSAATKKMLFVECIRMRARNGDQGGCNSVPNDFWSAVPD